LKVLIIYLFDRTATLLREKNRWENNYISSEKDHAREQELTRKEFAKFYPQLDSMRKALGMRLKEVEHITVIDYKYKDSTLLSTIAYYDSVTHTKNFTLSSDCYTLICSLHGDTITKKFIEFKDTLSVFLRRYRPNKFWFVRWGNWIHDARVWSKCKNDTVNVSKNIKLK
jgi:hypothetical protein